MEYIKSLLDQGYNLGEIPNDLKKAVDLVFSAKNRTSRIEALDYTTFCAIREIKPTDPRIENLFNISDIVSSKKENNGFNTFIEPEPQVSLVQPEPKSVPNGLVDVDFAGTILTLPESENQLLPEVRKGTYIQERKYETGGSIKSTQDYFESGNLQIRNVGGEMIFYKRVNNEWKFLTPEEKEKLDKGTKHELEHRNTIETFRRNDIPTEVIASFIAYDHIKEDFNYYQKLEKAIPENLEDGKKIEEFPEVVLEIYANNPSYYKSRFKETALIDVNNEKIKFHQLDTFGDDYRMRWIKVKENSNGYYIDYDYFGGRIFIENWYSLCKENYKEKMASGKLIKRADGSYSERGLWDNIRDNAGSGKEPTPEMLDQERKIKAKYDDGGLTGDDQGAKEKAIKKAINDEINSPDLHRRILEELEAEIEALKTERQEYYDEFKDMTFSDKKMFLMDKYDMMRLDINNKSAIVNYVKNAIKCLENSGKLKTITDKKAVVHNFVSDWRNVPTDNIIFKEETILVDPVPVFIPILDEDMLKRRGFIFDAMRIEPDTYLVSTTQFIDAETPFAYSKYVIVTLDQLVLISDYYYKKVRATLQAEAENQTLRQEQYYDSLPEERRQRHLNQPNFYHSLPVAIQKKISQVDYEALDLAGKEKLYKPFKRYKSKRITSNLEADKMYSSFHLMYERFINPEAVMPRKGFANNEVWSYWASFREMMDFKIKDIQAQREYLNEAYATAVETSFGESNTSTILKETYGVLVKRQNGDKINAQEIKQIEDALIKIYSCFGNCRKMALKDNMKISHTGTRLVFGTKAVGIYHPKMHTISSSNKYGNDQFQMTMAHEFGHFIDNFIGMSKGKMYASGEYESLAGQIAFNFRNNMNKPKDLQSDYVNSTQECFARAFEQFFTLEELGEDAGLFFSYRELDRVTPISNSDDFVKLEKFDEIIRPLIVRFLDENKEIFDKTLDLSVPAEPLKIENTDFVEVKESIETRSEPKSDPAFEIKDIEDALRGLEAYLPFASGEEKQSVVDAVNGLKALHKMMKTQPSDVLPTPSLTPKRGERDLIKEAKDYFIEAGFIDEMDTTEQHFLMELIKAIDLPYRTQGEMDAEEYFIENQMAEQLTTDKKFYVEKLVENSKKKTSKEPSAEPTPAPEPAPTPDETPAVEKLEGQPDDPAYLMTIEEYQQKVTPLIQEYRKFLRKNDEYFRNIDYGGLRVVDLQEVIDSFNAGKNIGGHFRLVTEPKDWEGRYTPEQQARRTFAYYKTRDFNEDFTADPTPQNVLDQKNDFLKKFEKYFTQEEIDRRVENDELKSPKRAIRRAIDNGTYKTLLENKEVTIEQLERVANSVGVRLPKSIFSKSTQNQMDYEKKLGELTRNLPKISQDNLTKMINQILISVKPLEKEIFENEMDRFSNIIKRLYDQQKVRDEEMSVQLPFYSEIFNYQKSKERTLGDRQDKIYFEQLTLKPDWKLKLSKIITEYIEYLKQKMILTIMANFDRITLAMTSITMTNLEVNNGMFDGTFRFEFENGSSFYFHFRSVGAGGHTIQQYHFRYISDFANVILADGSKGGTSLYEIIRNFSKKSE